jgi:Protein of unknown function (DUF3429)
MDHKLARLAFLLGLSGLLPQVLAAALALHPPHAAFAHFAAFLYAALILSFLGGLWWGIAAANRDAPRWLFLIAVVPSLIAFGAGLVWIVRTGSPALSLRIIGVGLLVSPTIDWLLHQRGLVPGRWLTMRVILSFGLGILTLAVAAR